MRKAFTLIELIFVIIIFGILSSFGAELLYKVYENYVYSNTFNRLQNQSESAVKQIANRLQYRIKDSTIARDNFLSANIEPIGSNSGDENVTEWIGVDIDGWKGSGAASTSPDWSGFIDLDPTASSASTLSSPGTSASTDTDLAIFFIGSNIDLNGNSFGWDGNVIGTQTGVSMHRVTLGTNTISSSLSAPHNNFAGVDVYEYYQLSKSAYAVSLEPDPVGPSNNLWFYYDYQPWEGDDIRTAGTYSKSLIMENVSSYKFTSMGDILIIQVCVSDGNVTGVGEYAVCKEKVVF